MHRHHVDAELAKGGGWRYLEEKGHASISPHDGSAVAAYLQQYIYPASRTIGVWSCYQFNLPIYSSFHLPSTYSLLSSI